jgi:hypothetical protein
LYFTLIDKEGILCYYLPKENKKGQEREDKNEWQNDVMDSAEYSLTRHMVALLRSCAKQ